MALVTASDFGSILQMFSSAISLHVYCVTEMELGLTFVLSSLVNKGFIWKEKKEQHQHEAAKSLLDVRHIADIYTVQVIEFSIV